MSVSTVFKSDIEISLGGTLIDVELEQVDYDYAFDKAKRVFQQRGNNNLDPIYTPFNVIPDTFSYILPTELNINDVVKIIKPKNSLAPADPFSQATLNSIFNMQYSGSMASYEMLHQSLDTLNIYLLHDTQFNWKKSTSTITLLDNPKISETWVVEAYANLPDLEYEDNMWIRNFTMSEAKMLLGNAYRKFSSLTAPSGETSLQGDAMIAEAKEEQLLLIEGIGDFIDGNTTGSILIIG